ncbi:hypothetical protein KPL70_009913 [Citrus sinensis]|nr:hypothetical protein KPL70_009913 [Citrus sinensis]
MASTSSSPPVTLSSTLSLPKSCTSHTTNKIENLVEYSYIPESAQISESSYPLLSPYQLYKRPSSFTRSIRTLISTRRPHPKEYIQSSRLDQCALQATSAEQYVTLEIPSELLSNWKREGYTHLHLGGIRLILTLHGRKGLPVTARLAMLDTRFKQYQDAVIGTVLTTLHAGSVLLTFYPNFNLSLQDPNLPTTLKVQVQIQGAEQISSAKIATLHHQLVYRLQNHALDLPAPEHHSDTLMVLAESDQIPTIIQIPRQIPRHELIKLMPLEWISNYEQFHNNTAPIQTSDGMFERRHDGTVRMTFKPPPSAPQEPPRLSFTYSSMITAVQTAQEDLPITGFNSQGYPVYPAKHNGHFLWDAPGSGMCDPNCPCWDDWEEDDDYATTRKKKPKKKKPPVPCHHCDPKPPSDPPPPPAPLPIYRKELTWIAKHCKSAIPSPLSHPTPTVQPLACMMFSSTSSDYSSSFPPLEPHTDSQRNVVSKPFIPSPITSTGHLEPPKPFESVLNWQTQNARAQNDTLVNINSKVEKISLRTEQLETKVDSISAQMQQIHQNLQSRIGQLDSELRAMLAHRYNGPEFDQKEREIRRLKAELAQIESEKQRPTLFTSSPLIPSIGPTYHPFASMLSPIKQYDPSKLFGMTHTLFRDNPLPPPPKPKPKPRPQPRPPPLHPSSLTIPGQPSPTFTPTSPPAPLSVPAQSKDKEPMNQFTAHAVVHSSTDNQTSDSNLAVSDSHTETDSESSASTSDSEKSYADITKILMAQPDQGQTSHTEPYVDIPSEVEDEMPESSATNQPSPAQPNPPSQKSSNGPWFTFDDLPSHKWRDRLNEMSAWIDLQMLRTGATTQSVLREFATRFTGALRDWFDSLGQYRQLQFVDLPEVSSALAVLHDQFLGDPSAVFEAARRDYLNMKCCSLNAKDLDFHYKRMSLLFYKLNGFNEPTLKHVFLASLPEELQPDIQRQLTASNLSLDNISLGKIFQLAKTCLDKLCEQKQFFKELLKDKEPFRSACKKPYLQIKCHKKKDCDCSSKKKRHFRKFKTPEFSSKPRRSRKPYRFFRKKSSSSREFKRKQSSRCFICKRKGHYAKDCPNKREKAIRLVEHLQATTDYSPAKDELEFYFSEQDEPNDETVFALQNSSDSDSDQSQVIFHQQLLSLDTTVPIPSIKLQILPSKFQRPIPAIGLIDTGAQRSMLNPHILPPEYWTQSEEHFKAVNGKLFTTSLITKKSIEYSYIPESAQISESSYPLLSPYQLYKRPSSFTRSIRTLISTRRPHPKEYIQSSRLDQCALQATSAEQYVTLEIPSELLSNWKREGYTHLHLGGIRLILTLHGRKGLPVTARLAMLDTRFKQYQDAVIGTVLTTLHAGSVLLTFYPNFNLSLQDPNLPTTLKVQVQIQGAEQISSAKIATLHHQLVYRLQNHALDLPAPEHHSDTLMVLAESDQIPTIIQIPRQIPRHELIKLMPLEWISNYEQFHNNTAPIQTSDGMFERRHDGTVRMTFKPPPSAPQEPPRLSFTYSSMITAVQTAQEDLPITGFNSQGYPVYPAKHNGHFLWDAPGSGMCAPNCPCWDDWEEDDDYATTRKKKPKKKKPPVPCHHCDPKPPSDPPPPPAPLPIYRKELTWIAKHCKSAIPSPLSHPTPTVQPLACMMFSSTSSDYSSSFPPLEPHTDSQRNVVSKPFIPSPITSTGHLEPPKPFESVLNWQTQNARAQNDTLVNINSKVEKISLRTEQLETKVDSISAQMQQIHQNLQSRIGQLDSELRAMLAHRYNGPEFDQKEREIRRLKAELAQIESEKQRPTLFTSSPLIPSIGPTYHPFASMLSPIKQYDPSKLFGMTHTLFRDNPLPPPPKPKPKPRPQPRPPPLHPSSLTIPGQPSPTFTPTSPPAPLSVPAQSKDKEPMNQFTAHAVIHSSTDDQTSASNLAVSDSHTETDSESSASTSDSEKSYADITKILMAQPDQGQTSHTEPYVDIPSEVEDEMPESSATNQPSPAQPNPPSQKSSNGPWFTFDDLPSHKWRDRLNEMSAWIDLQMLRTGATTQSVLREFATRFTGALRDWFDSLGQYRQLQFVDLPEVSSALAVLHDQFLGDPSAVFEAARRDYLNMKCCSLNAKDLDFHYKRMSLLFYKLNGFNEPTLKHVFLASLPEELQPDIQRQLTASNLSLDNISLGKIFQLAKTCLDKLCEQKQFFKELLKDKEPFRSACKKPYLQIKCHKKKDCDCSSKKKRHFRKFKTPEFSSKPRRSRKPYRFFRKKSSSSREFKRKQSSRCFICKRKGHYAKDCPNKREKAIRLVEHLQATTDYSPAKDELEFYFSEQDEPNDETVFALQNSSDSDSDQSQVIFHQQLLSLDTTVPIPSIKLQILPSKFQRPIPAIGLIDTGAQRSMLNPHILPPEYWTQSEEHFKAVNGKLFTTSLITKKSIGIQIFPNCVIWTKVIGSTLPNKDILLGFDILHQIKHLQIIPTGIRVKSMFKPFTNILKLYNLSETPQSYQDISTKLLSFCPESHSEFTHPNPLWKNKSFFIKLPFKLNEDINPTKATHPGMSPSDLLLAQQECSQLLAQGLIEPTSSQWACQAFYVEKHSEIVRGKKRLVIDYQPLNMFLQDDKFPLPRRQSMFTFLKNAQIFSKFDLKSGFWQLGIEPSERYKTAFCIPNAHFQWTVLPFGLKTAPSIFQKSMVQIFQPILHHALIYIDDILLFSGSHEEHRNLLSQFYDIIQSHGIMLSAKKSTIATDNIEFLGMIIKDGHYQPGKHIAQELLHFPDQQLSKRQIQQFLGIINYIRDFLPHVDHHTHHLSALLKKQPPEWNADHTRAVTTLKQIAQNPPPLKLLTDGKRILQTDASDESWGAILLEELNDKEHFIAYASGHFSETQKHYHSVFKEILAVKNGIKKFEYHLIGHHFLIRMDSSAFPNIFHFKGKTVPEKMLLRLKDWFSKYDFSVKHIKGSQNLIPDMLSRLSKPQGPLTLFSTTYHFPIISMATSLPPEALTKKTFPFNKTFSSVFDIQEFARKALFRFFMKAYLVTDPFPFSTFHPENLFLTGLTLDPTRDTTEDVLWYIWCLTVLYATKLVLPISPTLDHLLNPDNATSLTWTLLEWFSPIPWWRMKLQQLSEIYNLDRMPAPEAQMFTSVFIIHRPYFQHPDTHLFWTQDQVYEWFTAPHIAVIENDIQDVLHNYLCQLNHQPPPLKDISHTSLGPQHDLLMIPTPSAISKPKSTGIIIKEERPDYTDFLYQDSQDPWEDFLPLSQHLHQFPQPTMDEPGPSVPGPSTQSSKRPAQPSKVDKATQTSPKYTPKCTPRDYNCPYPPCRGPSCKHPKLSKTFFQKHPHSGDTDPDETESSSEDEYMNLRSP